MYRRSIIVLLAGLVPLAGAAQQPPAVTLEGAWVRALPPTQSNTAAYLTVSNRGGIPVDIVGGSADLAHTVEIHTSREIDGYTRMEQLEGLSVAPGESVQLSPGGTHLMLLGLTRMPAPGETLRLCLNLASGGEVCTRAGVHKAAPGQQHHQHHNN